uniref:Uncharacterized protein n=1 Tax=Arundo donax TaxID=35708 RepID=A0A0A9BH81_ARUDO
MNNITLSNISIGKQQILILVGNYRALQDLCIDSTITKWRYISR